MHTLFALLNLAVLPFWFLVIVLPRWRGTQHAVGSLWVLLPLPIVYVALVVPLLPRLAPLFLDPTLDATVDLLATPEGAVTAWAHFLAFDLFVGRWIYLDANERRVPWWLTSPTLLLTLMLGPMGLLAYLSVRLAFPEPPRATLSPGPSGESGRNPNQT